MSDSTWQLITLGSHASPNADTVGGRLRPADVDSALQLGQLMLDKSPVSTVMVDCKGRLCYANIATSHLLGYSCEELAKMTIFDVAPHRRPDMWGLTVETLRRLRYQTFASDWRTSDGRVLAVDIVAACLEHADQSYVLLYAHTTSDKLELQKQAFRLTHLDPLTGLPNRELLQNRLCMEAALATQDGRAIALMVTKVNLANEISDDTPAPLSDQVLAALTRRLWLHLSSSDVLAHLGNGEFAFLLARDGDVTDETLLHWHRHVLASLATPIQTDGLALQLMCDTGVVTFPHDTDQWDHMLRQAQSAMRLAQSQGPNQICSYTPKANERLNEHRAFEHALRHALDRNELCLHYQPQLDLTTGKIIGAEALLRWNHPELGELSPSGFLALAEKTGLILPISAWVIKTATGALAKWQQEGLHPGRMAVNLSPKQLDLPDIARIIESILMESGVDACHLTIEVTEGMLMGNLDHVARALSNLKSIGIEIALDDFGAGYSSLSCLRHLPIDVIKIDRSLVPDVTAATQDVSITRAIINMAHSLQVKVQAVGVESEGELALLVANHCDRMQGFLFSPPVDEASFAALLREGRALPAELLRRHDRKRTLLIVDDEDNIVSSLKRLLRRDGYQIVTANGGQQGLQRLAEHAVDVIISDQRMPGMTGVEFLRRAKELYPDTVRMVLSGYTELQSITDAINEGAIYKFLTKPWDDERLRSHINEAFRQKEMADENHRLDREVQEANHQLAAVNGKLQALLASQQERMQREEASLIVAREVLEHLPTPVIGIDQDGMIAFMNHDALALFQGATAMLGMYVQDVPWSDLALLWRESDGLYHDINLDGRFHRAVCRPMSGQAPSRGSLMVLAPRV